MNQDKNESKKDHSQTKNMSSDKSKHVEEKGARARTSDTTTARTHGRDQAGNKSTNRQSSEDLDE